MNCGKVKRKIKVSQEKISDEHNTDTPSRYRPIGAQQQKAQLGLYTHGEKEMGCLRCVPVPAWSRGRRAAGRDASGERQGKENPDCKRSHTKKALEETHAYPSQDKPKQHGMWSDTQSMV